MGGTTLLLVKPPLLCISTLYCIDIYVPICFLYRNEIHTTPFLHMRYDGTDCALMVTPSDTAQNFESRYGNFGTSFTSR